MNTISNNKVNFKGTFVVNYKNSISGMREGFEHAIGKHKRLIFDGFGGKKDTTLYVLKDSKDYDAAMFLKANNKRFKYMPDINTKASFEYLEDAEKYILENKPRVITKIKDLIDFVTSNRMKQKANYRRPINEYIFQKFGITNDEVTRVKDSRGITFYKDKTTGDTRVQLSPFNENGTYFVRVKDSTYPHEISRYAVDRDGNFLYKFSTPDDVMTFNEKFKLACQFLCNPEKFTK